ncbi:MAG TPA: helix-turn-helix transcriptional regulator [Blastocatellia bacterium]|nr:helix-turn-helix transcriptional regulator [Blastocatellia bacterium]
MENANMSEAKNGLGEYVKRVMKLKGLTQKDVQRMSGQRITDGYVASITTGRASNLSVDKLVALADGLGVDANDLFHVACGQPLDVAGKGHNGTDSLKILETVQKIVLSPEITEILHEVVRLSTAERADLLHFVNELSSKKPRSRRKQ